MRHFAVCLNYVLLKIPVLIFSKINNFVYCLMLYAETYYCYLRASGEPQLLYEPQSLSTITWPMDRRVIPRGKPPPRRDSQTCFGLSCAPLSPNVKRLTIFLNLTCLFKIHPTYRMYRGIRGRMKVCLRAQVQIFRNPQRAFHTRILGRNACPVSN